MSGKRSYGELRIIAGKWRGRRVPVLAQTTLRPTTDSIRETLFNWLQHVVAGAHCLDVFAGSGALGLEALSRGAAAVTFIDNNPVAVKQLKQLLVQFAADNAKVLLHDVRHSLTPPETPYDLVFLDPPFGFGYLAFLCDILAKPGYLAPGALVYLESEATLKSVSLPPDWQLLKEKFAGNVCYRLVATPSNP